MASKLLPSRSFLIQIISTGGLAMVGDAICQTAVEKTQKYDPIRTLKFGLVTTCVIAPIQFTWFRFLSRHFVKAEQSAFVGGVKRMLLDQTIAAPLLTFTFLFLLSVTEPPHTVEHAVEHTKKIIAPVMMNNYKLWPAVQVINMSLVPLHFRVVFVQFVAIFWNMYISHTVNKKE